MIKEEIKIITLGDIFKNIETDEKAFKFLNYIKKLQQENQQLKKQKDDVVEAIKGILEINNNYSIEKLVPFYSRKWVEDTQSDLLRMLGETE